MTLNFVGFDFGFVQQLLVSSMSQYVQSGEPLPIPPGISHKDWEGSKVELEVYHRKLTDYLRRLTAKLSADLYEPSASSSGGGFRVFSATLDTASDFTPTSDAWNDIPWETLIRKDTDVFTHSVSSNPDEITVLMDGFYLVHLDVLTDYDFLGDPMSLRLVEVTKGSLDYSLSYDYFVGGTLTLNVGVNLAANEVLKLQVYPDDSTASDLLKEGTRLTILYTPHDGNYTDLGSGVGDLEPIDYFTT